MKANFFTTSPEAFMSKRLSVNENYKQPKVFKAEKSM